MKLPFITFLGFVILACAYSSRLLPLNRDKNRRAPAYASPEKFTYESLKKLIQENGLSDIQTVIQKLPEDCRSNFALVRKSRSLQYGDDLNPRVILFCDSARLLVAYGNESSKQGYDTIEAIQFDDYTDTFAFREINFYATQSPSYNESPASCIQCHRNSLRPNWDSYDLWPGFYGGERDSGTIVFGSEEDKSFRSFLSAHEGKQDRYSPLIGMMKLDQIKENDNGKDQKYSPIPDLGVLNSRISVLNFLKIMNEMKHLPFYRKYKFAALAAISGCDHIEAFIPSSIRSGNKGIDFSTVEVDTKRTYRDYVIRKFRSQGNFSRGPREHRVPLISDSAPFFDPKKQGLNGYDVALAEPIASLRYVMALQGKDIESWFLARDEGSYSFDDGGENEFQLSALLAEDVLASDPEFTDDFQIAIDAESIKMLKFKNKEIACGKLRVRSMQMLSSQNANRLLELKSPEARWEDSGSYSTTSNTLNSCIRCHTSKDGDAPAIPFDNPSELSASLRLPGYRRGTLLQEIQYRLNATGPERMPQGKYLGKRSREGLMRYFESVMEQ